MFCTESHTAIQSSPLMQRAAHSRAVTTESTATVPARIRLNPRHDTALAAGRACRTCTSEYPGGTQKPCLRSADTHPSTPPARTASATTGSWPSAAYHCRRSRTSRCCASSSVRRASSIPLSSSSAREYTPHVPPEMPAVRSTVVMALRRPPPPTRSTTRRNRVPRVYSLPVRLPAGLARMTGRDPGEEGRAGSSLEIFYDLVFVVAFSVAGVQLADYLADGHFLAAIGGYLLVAFASIWAWINFAWFSSAFDTDDWFYRILTLVQMIGVGIVAIGLPDVFASIDADAHIDLTVTVIGYIVMRVGMVTQWIRAAIQAPAYRQTALAYAVVTLIAQAGWIALIFLPTNLWQTFVAVAILVLVEIGGPYLAENRYLSTPWNPEHIADRYATLMVITLGEGVVGTVAVLQAQIGRGGWNVQTAVLGLAAMGVTFGMWWLYFSFPNGEVLRRRPGKCFGFGYGSMPLFIVCAAVGAGLHVVALWIEGHAHLGDVAVFSAVAVPVGLYCLGVIAMDRYLTEPRRTATAMAAGALLPLLVGGAMAAAGVTLIACVVVACLTPVLPIVIAGLAGDEIDALG